MCGEGDGETACEITVVVAAARNRVIGLDGTMPWHLPADLAHFKATTLGGTLIMGRRTYDSVGRPLPGRHTIVVTRQTTWVPAPEHANQVTVVHSLADAIRVGCNLGNQLFAVGGGDLYRQVLPQANRVIYSEVDAEPEGDTTFPVLDATDWKETNREPHQGFDVVTYERH